jgi:hypothetical protein
MSFGADFYVPVLKLKRGEKKALQLVAPTLQGRMVPLLELVERKGHAGKNPPPLAKHLDTAFNAIAAAVAPYPRFFLDCREIEPDGPTAADDAFTRVEGLCSNLTPVTGITRTADVNAALSHGGNGVAIRLTRQEFESGAIPFALPAFIKSHSLKQEQTDLIVDLGPVDDMIALGVETLTAAFLADIPDARQWRSLTISGCAFPQSMGGVDANSSDLVDRAEWCAWRDGLYANRGQAVRLPTFSDCALQHPTGVEGFNPRIMQVSASIRVTQLDQWLLVKGVSTRNIPPSTQFPSLARQLVYGHLSKSFAGANHCAGCADMFNAANGAANLGSAETWRRLGTIHHLTRAAEMIAALSWP